MENVLASTVNGQTDQLRCDNDQGIGIAERRNRRNQVLPILIVKKERFEMKNEKSGREKTLAIMSVVFLALDVFVILIAAVGTIIIKGNITTVLTEFVDVDHELPVITKFFFISIPAIAYGIFFALFILILILKELYVRSKIVTLVMNIVAGVAAIVYVFVYIIALFLPIANSGS